MSWHNHRWHHHNKPQRTPIPLEDNDQPQGRGHWQLRDGEWWEGQGQWQPGHTPSWARHGWHPNPRRRLMFVRFGAFLVVIVILIAGAMALLSHLLTTFYGGQNSITFLVWISGCGLALALPILAMAIGARVFRSYAIPLADIMDAAEAVATGDLDVRVKERGSREFQQLANSFNRMTEELARTDQQRRNLTADVAHELRTPLHIIQGNLEGVLDGVYAPTAEHIDATLQETRTLARLVDDLRTLSLAESGQLPLHPEIVDVHDLLADVCTSFSPQAESAGIHLCVGGNVHRELSGEPNMDAKPPLTLYGDPGRLDQVLSNLVSNALRHTPSGGKITLNAVPVQTAEGYQVQLTVADTGAGIAASDLPFVFDRFWRADRARTHTEGTGSGLGLAIAGQLVKAHGGTISVASVQGQGTTFTVTLPADISGATSN